MSFRKSIYRLSKIAVVSLLILLTLSTFKLPFDPPLLASDAGDSLSFFEDFTVVPGSVAVIEDRYILALLKNSRENLYAVMMFTADCSLGHCTVGELVAYSMFDTQGQDIQLANNLQVRALKLHKRI